MIVNPISTALWWVWITFLALLAWLFIRFLIRRRLTGWNPKHQWKVFAAFSVLVVLPWTVYREVFDPMMGGIYSAEAARYWVERAARESDRGAKTSHVARIALSSEYGSHVAMQAIGDVADERERCLLRTILAELPKVRDQEQRRKEAQEDCGKRGQTLIKQ